MALNFGSFFEKLAEIFRKSGSTSPILNGFQESFCESSELRESLSGFYAVVVEFCTGSLLFLKSACRFLRWRRPARDIVISLDIDLFCSHQAVCCITLEQHFRFSGVRNTAARTATIGSSAPIACYRGRSTTITPTNQPVSTER